MPTKTFFKTHRKRGRTVYRIGSAELSQDQARQVFTWLAGRRELFPEAPNPLQQLALDALVEPMTITELADEIGRPQSSVRGAVNRLVDLGLVEREVQGRATVVSRRVK